VCRVNGGCGCLLGCSLFRARFQSIDLGLGVLVRGCKDLIDMLMCRLFDFLEVGLSEAGAIVSAPLPGGWWAILLSVPWLLKAWVLAPLTIVSFHTVVEALLIVLDMVGHSFAHLVPALCVLLLSASDSFPAGAIVGTPGLALPIAGP